VTGRSRTCDASRFRRVLRLDDPGTRGRPLHPRPLRGRRCSGGPILGGRSRPLSRPPRKPNDVVQATRLPFDPGSPTAGCAIRDGRRPTWRSFGARASRTSPKIGRQKPELNTSIHFFSVREESFSLRRGLDSVSSFFKLGITSLRVGRSPPETTKATRWVALDWLEMRLET